MRVEANVRLERCNDEGVHVYDVRVAGEVQWKDADHSDVEGPIEIVQSEPELDDLEKAEQLQARDALVDVYVRDVLQEPAIAIVKAMVMQLGGGEWSSKRSSALYLQLWARAELIGWPALRAVWEHAPADFRRAVLGREAA